MDGQADRSSVVVNGVAAAAQNQSLADATIGILGIDVYEANRGTLDLLAFQAPGQKFGFYPDSTVAHKDKRNVRDGHYVPWSYTTYIAAVDADKKPLNPLVTRLLEMTQGDTDVRLTSAIGVAPAYDIDALQVFASKGLVPACAMKVSREKDGGDFSLYDSGHALRLLLRERRRSGLGGDRRLARSLRRLRRRRRMRQSRLPSRLLRGEIT